ncbi:hypothetical protein QOZ80_7BG0593490 [Eleusine coracana subsp. coracana]|nr:hypothetical protein QOZ80_7BG0593490 [Eleusine coracana subsp. coracana]
MQSTRKPWFVPTFLIFLLLVSTAHGAELANAEDAAATETDGGERTTVRTGAAGHAGHGYSGHSGAHTNGDMSEQGGAGVVDPRNLNARSRHRNGATSRVVGYSSRATYALLGALVMMVA